MSRHGHVVVLIALAVPVAIDELDDLLTGPDVWTDLDIDEPDLFVKLPVECRQVILTGIETATGERPDRRGRELEADEKDRVIRCRDDSAHRLANAE